MSQRNKLYKLAFIFQIVFGCLTCFYGFLMFFQALFLIHSGIAFVYLIMFIPVICVIPMSLYTKKIMKEEQPYPQHTAFGICVLLFNNIISGILLLVADSSKSQEFPTNYTPQKHEEIENKQEDKE